MPTLFISDLHLSQSRPDKLDLLQEFLAGPARTADGLYILGDLFEAWAGDDDRTPLHENIIQMLAEYTIQGNKLYFMRGNRDFLVGNRFIRETGAKLIPDPTVIRLYGTPTLLMHGDSLCSKDIAYQLYKKCVNNPPAIALFRSLPYPIRKRIWHGVRQLTVSSSQRKSPEIVDVHQPTVEKTMKQYGVHDLIHGHTHKQAVHQFSLDGKTARRYVLGDWYDKDSVLVTDEGPWQMLSIEDYIRTCRSA